MNDLKLKMILEAIDKASPDINKVDGNMSRLNKTTKEAGVVMKAFGGIVTGLVLGKLAADFIDVNTEFDRLHASLITVTGSAAAADSEMEKIKEFAKTTPYQLAEVTDAFIKMRALGLDASERSLRSYGNTASAMGKSLNQMIEAVADATTGEYERLKEFGIKSSSEGDKVKFTFRGVTTTVNKNAKEISDYLKSLGEVEFAGGMERQMDTLGGKLSNLSDAWDDFVRTVGESGALEVTVGIIEKLTQSVTNLGNAARLFKELREGNVSFWDWVFANPEDAKNILQKVDDGTAKLEELQARVKSLKKDKSGNFWWTRQDEQELQSAITLLRDYKSLLNATKHIAAQPVTGSSGPGTPTTEAGNTNKQLKEYAKLGKGIVDIWQTQIDERYEVQSRGIDAEIQLEKEAAELTKVVWEATTDSWNQQYNDRFDVMSRGLDAEIQLFTDWKTTVQDTLADIAASYDETFNSDVAGVVTGAFSSMEDALVKFTTTGKFEFSSMVNSIVADIARIVIQKNVSAPIAQALNDVFANANGNIFANGRVLPFASGTIVARPTYFPMADGNVGLMGEAGAEGILPLKRVNGKLGVYAQGGGGPQAITFNQSYDLRGADETAIPQFKAAAEEAANLAVQKINRQMQRGGAAYRYSRG